MSSDDELEGVPSRGRRWYSTFGVSPQREHILSMDCWCRPTIKHYGADDEQEGEDDDV
jgi:hypothetical protein